MSYANLVIAALVEAKVKFGPPPSWNKPQVAAWVREQVESVKNGTAPEVVKRLPSSRLNLVPFVPADEREALQAEASEDGWR